MASSTPVSLSACSSSSNPSISSTKAFSSPNRLAVSSYCGKIARKLNVVAMATTGEATAPPAAAAEVVSAAPAADTPPPSSDEILTTIQKAWDKVEDKYAVTSLVVAGGVALCASAGMISAIDRLPLIPGVLELVGIGYTGWFAYQNLVFKPNREALIQKVKDTYKDIIGSS